MFRGGSRGPHPELGLSPQSRLPRGPQDPGESIPPCTAPLAVLCWTPASVSPLALSRRGKCWERKTNAERQGPDQSFARSPTPAECEREGAGRGRGYVTFGAGRGERQCRVGQAPGRGAVGRGGAGRTSVQAGKGRGAAGGRAVPGKSPAVLSSRHQGSPLRAPPPLHLPQPRPRPLRARVPGGPDTGETKA